MSSALYNKDIYKSLKYIKRHGRVTLGQIQNKFGKDVRSSLWYLSKDEYLIYINDDDTYEFAPFSSSETGKYALTMKAEEFLFKRRQTFIQWFIPVLISILILFIELIDIFITLY